MRIVLVGGGSGGHFYPLIATAEALNSGETEPKLYYFGPDEFDAKALTKENISYVYCPAGKTRRYFSIANFFDFFKNIFGLIIAIFKLFIIYPDVVFSKGGYTSIPVMFAAKILMIPIVIHESDSVPGRASKIGSKLARYIGIAYDEVAEYFSQSKTALVGIPIRNAVQARYNKDEALQALNIPNDKPLLYVTGGSLGAERLNNQIIEALPTLLPYYNIFHQVGDKNVAVMQETVQAKITDTNLLSGYFLQGSVSADTVALLLSASSLVISRSGSTTLHEIAHHQKPAILIPIPESISHDQRTNAYAYARNGAATVIEQENLNESLLVQEINTIMSDNGKYQAMVAGTSAIQYPDAATKIADILLSIGKEHGSI